MQIRSWRLQISVIERLIRSLNIPVVEVWQLPRSPIDIAVGFSNFQAGYDMAHHLIDNGRKNIAFLGGHDVRDERGRRRREEYLKALNETGIVPIIWPNDELYFQSVIELGAAFFAGCLDANPQIDAVMCVSDPVAVGVLCEARRRDVNIPEDLAITRFGGFEVAMPSGFNLTTIEIPRYEIGTVAAKALLDPENARGKNMIDLGYQLIKRGTT